MTLKIKGFTNNIAHMGYEESLVITNVVSKAGHHLISIKWVKKMNHNFSSSSSSKFYFQQNTTMEQYQGKENTL